MPKAKISSIRETKKKERLSIILKTARVFFEKYGYEKTKTAHIAAEIGIAEGTIFNYFGTKKGLVIKVMEEFYQQNTIDLEKGLKKEKGTRNRLYYIIHFHLNVNIENAALCGVIFSEARKGIDNDLALDIFQFNKAYSQFLKQVLEEGIQLGDLKKDISINLVQKTIYGTVESILWSYLVTPQNMNVAEVAEQLTNQVLGGIGTSTVTLRKHEIAQLVHQLNQLLGKGDI